ncbi:MAG: Holliday junction resolvase RuvX [Pseudomonadales bacterium]|jgi:putative Holliday junction resolvase|nr:Holliday junction resolvase RuvX [Pseudomonadales bacterium]
MSTHQTLLALDYGTKKLGVAVGQTLTRTATGIAVLPVRALEPDWAQLDTIIQRWKPDAFVLGLPFNMDGSDSAMTTRARQFGAKLQERYHKPIHGVDERLSTREARDISRQNAERAGKRPNDRALVDALAAQLLLEGYLGN